MYTLIGKKKDMTQVFDDDWKKSPVTLVDLNSATVARIEGDIMWIGFGLVRKPSKALSKIYSKLGYVPQKAMQVDAKDYEGAKIGAPLSLDNLYNAKVVISGISKGKGFAGVVKRYHVKGGKETHGQKDHHRKIGSIGAQTPGKVFPGKKMPGRHGNSRVTIKNTKILYVDKDARIVGIKGGIPGGRNALVEIRISKPGEEMPEPEPKPKSKQSGDPAKAGPKKK